MRHFWTTLLLAATVHLIGAVAFAEDAPLTWDGVRLTRTRGVISERGAGGLLAREIVAQAFLVAARDEFGLSTRDECLDEAGPRHAVVFTATIGCLSKSVTLLLMRADSTHKMQQLLPLSPGWTRYRELVSWAEGLSRTDYPKLLEQEGFQKQRLPDGEESLSDAVRNDLKTLSLLAQFAAVRSLHGLCREKGESAQLLGGLVRGYAHLGLLSENHFSCFHEVFKARSLLYAERMVVRYPKSAEALWHRAYAYALCGFPAAAESDLMLASGMGAVDLKVPAWQAYIKPYCRYELSALQSLAGADAEDFEIGNLLTLLTARQVLEDAQAFDIARKLEPSMPHCQRLEDEFCVLAEIDAAKAGTKLAMAHFQKDLHEQLAMMTELPKSVGKVSNRPASRAKLVSLLAELGTGDVAEPSWGVLAGAINDTMFLQAYRRWHLLFQVWSNEEMAAEFLKESQTQLSAHRWQNLLSAMSGLAVKSSPAPDDPDVRIRPFFQHLPALSEATTLVRLLANVDLTVSDLSDDISNAVNGTEDQVRMARELLHVSPASLVARAVLLAHDPAVTEAELAEWQGLYSKSPKLLRAIVVYRQQKKQLDQALQAAKDYVAAAEGSDSLMLLAECYRQDNNVDEWRECMLKAYPFAKGLAASRILFQIANEYIKRGNYKAAERYAVDCAESYAQWGLECAHQCYEGLDDVEKAELYIRRVSERYDSRRFNWYFWCCRTGHGDRSAALLRADEIQDQNLNTPFKLALTNQHASAKQMFEQLFRADFDPRDGLLAASEALELKQPAEAQRILAAIRRHSRKFQRNGKPRQLVIECAELLAAALQPMGTMDIAAIEKQFAEAQGDDAEQTAYIVGRFFEHVDNHQQAKKFYEMAANSKNQDNYHRVLAAVALRRLVSKTD